MHDIRLATCKPGITYIKSQSRASEIYTRENQINFRASCLEYGNRDVTPSKGCSRAKVKQNTRKQSLRDFEKIPLIKRANLRLPASHSYSMVSFINLTHKFLELIRTHIFPWFSTTFIANKKTFHFLILSLTFQCELKGEKTGGRELFFKQKVGPSQWTAKFGRVFNSVNQNAVSPAQHQLQLPSLFFKALTRIIKLFTRFSRGLGGQRHKDDRGNKMGDDEKNKVSQRNLHRSKSRALTLFARRFPFPLSISLPRTKQFRENRGWLSFLWPLNQNTSVLIKWNTNEDSLSFCKSASISAEAHIYRVYNFRLKYTDIRFVQWLFTIRSETTNPTP